MRKVIFILILLLLSTKTFLHAGIKSIFIEGPDFLYPGTGNDYFCRVEYDYNSRYGYYEDINWKIANVEPYNIKYENYLRLINNEIKVSHFVEKEFQCVLRCKYDKYQATKEITVLPTAPYCKELSQAYLWWLPQKSRHIDLVPSFGEQVSLNSIFKPIREEVFGKHGNLKKRANLLIKRIQDEIDNSQNKENSKFQLILDGRDYKHIKIEQEANLMYAISFKKDKEKCYFEMKISLNQYDNENDTWEFFNSLDLITKNECKEYFQNEGYYIVFPRKPIYFEKPGKYKLKMNDNSLEITVKESVEKQDKGSQKNNKNNYLIHIVGRGETLWGISKKYNISIDEILEVNNISDQRIYVGNNIRIPIKNSFDSRLVFVPGGTFLMGSDNGEEDERPIHEVSVGDFYISPYEVTVNEFKEFIDATGYVTDAELKGYSYIWNGEWNKRSGVNWRHNEHGDIIPLNEYKNPVIHVSWQDALAYCAWKDARLPTEAEWEYAARGGSKSHQFEFAGNDDINKVAWYRDNSQGKIHKIGMKEPNELGLYDMTGNVWEWCYDIYNEEYYSTTLMNDPEGASLGQYRVTRGGSWFGNKYYNRVTHRNYANPDFGNNITGFRVARSP